ncbi:uncharacterized protein N0V89_008899 [Didymosphaeria variabile]|uniref:BTB domain-containing protein n=1 Tax=Didymosphaeria variabile TaxID=1932322 RepID=A0A9W8XHB2_9PLEO|nr:uncharacterized protein N0V89_008899 [Didymosphaeria variabile]KAJ4350278.1 hypothetical protein N0V89_008899 [Didymosphaeria variabile]
MPSSDDDATPIDPELLDARPVGVATPEPASSFVEVIVNISPTTQRTWSIQRPVVSRHSAYLRAACDSSSSISLDLTSDSLTLAALQNFIDFSHSSIYSVNKRAAGHHIVQTHLQSWVLGAKLEAPTYQTAALQELYTWIEPLARAVNGSVADSPIRVEDVDFVCRRTQEGCVLRALVFDAVAAHWTQQDAINIGTNLVRKSTREAAPEPGPQPTEVLTWTGLYNKYPDFRKRISSSLKVQDSQRTCLLRPVTDYIAGKTGMQEEEFVSEGTVSSFFGMRPRASRGGGHMRSPSHRRRSSSASSEGSQRGRSRERQVGENEYMNLEDA